jgi:RimJ/RimL family protein N-acetyltransferase
LKPTERGWLRVWILTDEREIFGELTLVHRPPLATSLHRCHLMMGLERKVRSLGFGSKLMTEAIEWAKRVPTLEYISLNVFENNPKAKSLYEKFGFVSEGTTRDLFRVYGQSIDDTQMSLRLR